MSDYLLKRRAIMMGARQADPSKEKKPIAKMSAKRKEVQKEYVKIVKKAAKKDHRCKVKSPDCTGKMQGMNHIQKKSPANITIEKNLTPSCNACNLYIELNTDWARNNGHLISRFAK